MKYLLIALSILLSSSAAWAQVPQIGKSIGRASYQNVEEMMVDKAKGLDYVEVTMNNIIGKDPEGAPQRAKLLMDDLQKAGIKVWSVHMPFSRSLDISVIDDAKRNANIQTIKDAIRMSAVFQPHRIVLHPSSEPILPGEREQRLINSHNAIREIAIVAKEIGAVLCIENLPRTCLGRNGEEMMRLIEGYDEVGICFDTNHLLYQSHSDFLKSIAKGKIKTVHMSDYDFSDERHLVPGNGLIDNKALWKGIMDNGYDGIMMFECKGNVDELLTAREILLGNRPQKDNSKKNSIAFTNAKWEITELERGAQAMYAQIPLFYSTQSVCVVKYPLKKFETAILDRPEKLAGKPSEIAGEAGAAFALNIGKIDSDEYHFNGAFGFKDKKGRKVMMESSSDAGAGKKCNSAMAAGPMLVVNGEIAVPLLTGNKTIAETPDYTPILFFDKRLPRSIYGTDNDGNAYLVVIDGRFKGQADGATIYEAAYICHMLGITDAINLDDDESAVLWTKKTGVMNHPYGNKKFDHNGESATNNLIVIK